MINNLLSFDSFLSLNESKNQIKKKDFGFFGPNSDGSFEILVGENTHFNIKESENNLVISSGDNSISIPKNSYKIIKTKEKNILKTLPYTNWFREDENMDSFENFVYDSVESKFPSSDEEFVLDNLEVLLEEMEIELPVNSIEKKKDGFYEIIFSNGMEGECKTESENGFIKDLKIYKSGVISDPIIKIKLLGKEIEVDFSSDIGNFRETVDGFSDLVKNPIFKYLSGFLIGKKNQEHEDYMIDYYKRLMKYHNWKESNNNESKNERHRVERKEINRIREILKHTQDDKDLEKLFIEARESFISSFKNS
jgi:hypothetical protein